MARKRVGRPLPRQAAGEDAEGRERFPAGSTVSSWKGCHDVSNHPGSHPLLCFFTACAARLRMLFVGLREHLDGPGPHLADQRSIFAWLPRARLRGGVALAATRPSRWV